DRRANVVLVGTSLTGIDVFLTLEQMNWRGKIVAVSRHCLLPLPYFPRVVYRVFDDDPSEFGFRRLVSVFRRHRRIMRERGIPLAVLVDSCRPFTQRIWRNLSLAEKRRFLHWFLAGWKVTRHRIPASVHERLVAAEGDGRLRIVRGNVQALLPVGSKIGVTITDRGASHEFEAGAVFNCTGPGADYVAEGGPLFQNLARRGLIVSDDLGMGVKVSDDFAAIDTADRPSTRLFALGNLLKGTLWETTGVPEMAGQAHHIAK